MKEKKINTYLCGDVSFVVFLLSVIAYSFNKVSTKFMGFVLGICAVFYVFSMIFGKAYVINESEKDIYAKDENSDTNYKILPGHYKSNIDGISVNGVVYKITDGTKVTIDKSGKVRYNSFSAWILNKIRKIDYEKLDDFAKKEWKPLFEK